MPTNNNLGSSNSIARINGILHLAKAKSALDNNTVSIYPCDYISWSKVCLNSKSTEIHIYSHKSFDNIFFKGFMADNYINISTTLSTYNNGSFYCYGRTKKCFSLSKSLRLRRVYYNFS